MAEEVRLRLRSYPFLLLPPALIGWLTAMVAVAFGLGAADALKTAASPDQLATWVVLTGCGATSVEALRREGEIAGVSKDLLSAWMLPVALLLPPVYSLLIPIPLTILLQRRVRRGLLHRRVYSSAVIGISNWVVSSVFHRFGQTAGFRFSGSVGNRTLILLLVIGCAAFGCAMNVLLIAIAARLSSLEATWRELIGDREQRGLDGVEICIGVVVTSCWAVTPALIVIMVPAVLLVQRSLTHAQLRAAARIDAKTGLLNFQAWQQEAEREIVQGVREQQPLTILIADLDNFKRVNDSYGHLAGDIVLKAAVAALSSELRPYDQLGRFGGEEFTIILPRTGHAEAVRVAERLRKAVAAHRVVLANAEVEMHVSIGVAVLGEHGQDLTDLLAAADQGLYKAKRSGKNRIAFSS